MPNGIRMTQTTNGLVELIRSIVKVIIKKELNKTPKEWVAIVNSATISPNGTGTVFLNGDTSSTPISIKNKSWESLSSGDECYIHSPTGSLGNAIVLYKK